MKSSLLLLAIVFVQRILALGAGADELEAPAVVADPGGGEGGEAADAVRTPANATAPAGGA